MIPDERQAGVEDEIEVTEEMIEAGKRELAALDQGRACPEIVDEIVENIFCAMAGIRMPEIDLRGLRAILILEEGQPMTKSLGISADTRLVAIPAGAIASALRAQKNILRKKILLGLKSLTE